MMIRLAAVDLVVCFEQACFFMIKIRLQLPCCEVIRLKRVPGFWNVSSNGRRRTPNVSAHHANMTADHQADILGEAVDEVKKSWPRVGVTGHHQTLGSTSEKHPRKHQTFTGLPRVFWAQDQTQNKKTRRRVAHIKANMLSTVGFNRGGERREEGAHTSHTEDTVRFLIISCLVRCHGNKIEGTLSLIPPPKHCCTKCYTDKHPGMNRCNKCVCLRLKIQNRFFSLRLVSCRRSGTLCAQRQLVSPVR